ncbi:acyl carrier protein [Actinophytocola oryzae]|uniref:Acyl carrier protein n=1 Tax=Actinophytocola oryzae TaxID=502181 RepID=A0A4V6Q6H4_9PSEU|nr:acyl carrier protein [Actinophytocola oryzae]TDV37790.1 acyl carrier protein [Actinophytocola oryzae]
MSTSDTVRSILVSKVYVEVPINEMDDDAGLRDDFGVDSLGFVELRAQLEDTFGIEIEDDDFNADNFSTIANIVGYVDRVKNGDAVGAPSTAQNT